MSQSARSASPSNDHDAVLDALGDMLRACGDHAFDTHTHKGQDLQKRAEQWSRHLLLGAPHPELPSSPRRDFGGARRFVRDVLSAQQQYVRAALTDFRTMLSSVFGNIERALSTEGETDQKMKISLSRLRSAVEAGASPDALRREVLSISSELSELLTTRERRRTEQVAALGDELKQLNQKLDIARRTAQTDALTGLHNRRALDSYMERVAEFDGLTGSAVSLLVIDVDNFKRLNDEHGHPAGDQALRAIGAALARTFLRKCDFVARFGGEEFVAVLRDTNASEARRASDRARAEVARIELAELPELELTVSVGVAQLEGHESVQEWLARADDALLEAKRTGKNKSVVAAVATR